ncbi:uncharacterized protein BCR38DRAFT_300023, partial [Pseudomassariella vexata]
FPDNSKIETFSQTQRQIIVNQNPNPLSANHIVGTTGQPFVQLSPNSMTIQTNRATDLVGAQIEMPIDPNVLAQNGVTADNTFVAMLSDDRQAWIVLDEMKSVNTTDSTVRMIKLNNIDGEFMAVGRQTVETGNVLAPFGQGQTVAISGSGIQEIEYTDGFRMSIRASQPMSVATDVVNGVSTSMLMNGVQPINNYRYLVTTSLAGVVSDLNSMVAVVQVPLNAQRIMDMAVRMGVQPNGAITLGVAQRGVISNPGGATALSPPQKRASMSSDPNNPPAADPNNPPAADQNNPPAADPNNPPAVAPNNPPAATPASPQAASPVATQLLLAPTFTPLVSRPLLDTQNNRIVVPVSQID